jgi:hypothetical protein
VCEHCLEYLLHGIFCERAIFEVLHSHTQQQRCVALEQDTQKLILPSGAIDL